MKQLLFLLLFPCLCVAQYTGNAGQKITLGEQTTADGLVYRGVANIDTVSSTSKITRANKQDTSAFILLDTVTNLLWHYKIGSNGWIQAGGSIFDTTTLNLVSRFALKLNIADTSNIKYVNTYNTQTVNGVKTLTSNLILKNSQEPSRATVVTTQTFAADTTNWTRGTGWTFNGTQAVATAATGNLTYTPSLTITSGNAYEITFTVTGYTGGTLTVAFGNASLVLPKYNISGNVILLLPASAIGGFRFTTSSFTGNIDDISIVEITGSSPVIFAGQDDGAATLYNSLRMPNSTTLAFSGGGSRTTGANNNFFGSLTGQNNTTGANNNFFGTSAGQNNTTGTNNNFFGTSAGENNTISGSNNFFGSEAGQNNTIGGNNNFFGSAAGKNNTTGGSNNFYGLAAGFNNATGTNNNFLGTSAGRSNKTGSSNVAIGNSAMYNTTVGDTLTGSNNIAIGTNAGDNIKFAADGNVIIGNDIDLPNPSGSNQVVIKNIIYATGANGTGTTSAGNVGIGTNAPLSKLNIMGTVRINSASAPDANFYLQLEDSDSQKAKAHTWATYSDTRVKTDIQPILNAIDKVNLLNPVYYEKHDSYVENDFLNIDYNSSIKSLGFIAQEVYNVIPEAVNTGTTNELWAMDYTKIIPVLTKAIQEQQALIKALEQRILTLENK